MSIRFVRHVADSLRRMFVPRARHRRPAGWALLDRVFLLRRRMEELEDRAVPATVTWDGGGDGANWFDPLNWDTGVPTASDDAVIPFEFASNTVNINSAAQALTLNTYAALSVTDSLQVFSATTVSNFFNAMALDHATFTVAAGGATIDSFLNTWDASTIAGTGTVTLLGSVNLTQSTNLETDLVIANTGEAYLVSDGILDIAAAGSLTIDGAFEIQPVVGGGAVEGSGNIVVTSNGTLRQRGAGVYSDIAAPLSNLGTVRTDGDLELGGAVTQLNSGVLTAGNWWITGSLKFPTSIFEIGAAATITLEGPTAASTDFDALEKNEGIFHLMSGAAFTTTANFEHAGPLLNIEAGSSFTLLGGTFTHSGFGQLDLAGSLIADFIDLDSTVSLAGGFLNGDIDLSSTATLGGSGSTGNVTNGGTVSPGNSPGVLVIDGNYTQDANGNLFMEIEGPNPGVPEYDQLIVTGNITLAGSLILAFGSYVPDYGTSFTLIDNQSSDPISGTFDGLPEGAIWNVGGLAVRITYQGGDGRDVVVTAYPAFVVTTAADSGAGSLREAIAGANASSDANYILFNIAAAGVQTISLISALPTLAHPVNIDARSQGGANYAGAPLIALDGTGLVNSAGFTITAANTTIIGFNIRNFTGVSGYGIHLSGATDARIESNFIGTDEAGAASAANTVGILVSDGSLRSILNSNVISGNGTGIVVRDVATTSTSIISNFIGLVADGTTILPNNGDGILISNSTDTSIGAISAGNRIAGNAGNGITVTGTSTTNTSITANDIGHAGTGPLALPGTVAWWRAEGSTDDALGVHHGAEVGGIAFGNGPNLNSSAFEFDGSNYIRVPYDPALKPTTGITLEAWFTAAAPDRSQTLISSFVHFDGPAGSPANDSFHLELTAEGNIVWQLVTTDGVTASDRILTAFPSFSVLNGEFHHIAATYDGAEMRVYIDGTLVDSLAATGDIQFSTTDVLLGATEDFSTTIRHLEGKLDEAAIYGRALTATEIDRIFDLRAGGKGTGNAGHGILVNAGAVGTSVEQNVIGGNVLSGILVSDSGTLATSILSNHIGVDSVGNALANGGQGVSIESGADGIIVGGSGVGSRNVISGNIGHGIAVSGAGITGVVIRGNHIGTDPAGATRRANEGYGIVVAGSSDVLIGGANSGEGNVISGNGFNDVRLATANRTIISGNIIGLDAAGSTVIPSGDFGIDVWESADVTIGGAAAAERNIISGHGNAGIVLTGGGSHDNLVIGNRIGTDARGLEARPNDTGILIENGAFDNLVKDNLVSGNAGEGIRIIGPGTTGNRLIGNIIGLDRNGGSPVIQESFDYTEGADVSGRNGGTGWASAWTGFSTLPDPGWSVGYRANNFPGSVSAAVENVVYLGNDGNARAYDTTVHSELIAEGGFWFSFLLSTTGTVQVNPFSGGGGINFPYQIEFANGNIVLSGDGSRSGTTFAAGAFTPGTTFYVVGRLQIVGAVNDGVNDTLELWINPTHGETPDVSTRKLNALIAYQVPGTPGVIIQAKSAGSLNLFDEYRVFESPGGLGNGSGLFIAGEAANNTIGGAGVGEGNVISGNTGTGIVVSGENTDGTVIEGNFIGTDANGDEAVGNGTHGIQIGDKAKATVVRGNVVSGNRSAGIVVSDTGTDNTWITANIIGLNKAGTAAVGNVDIGIHLTNGSQFTTIGTDRNGTDDVTEGNVISGNSTGVWIGNPGTDSNLVAGNRIGTNAAGDTVFANGGGVLVDAASTNVIRDNLISGNSDRGVWIFAGDDNRVQGNTIGTNASGQGRSGGIAALYKGEATGRSAIGVANGNVQGVAFTAGKVGQGFLFTNDPAQMIAVATENPLRLDRLTIETWINLASAPVAGTDFVILTKGIGAASEEYGLYIRNTGTALELVFKWYAGGAFHELVSSGSNLATGAFRHVAATLDGDQYRFYVDGVALGEGQNYGPALIPAAGNLQIGSTFPAFNNSFDGIIDELGIYRWALEPSEIAAIHTAGAAGIGIFGNGTGVDVDGGATNTKVGGANAGEGNLVSGNRGLGIIVNNGLSTGTVIAGNIVGLDSTGQHSIGNADGGIRTFGGSTVIGGLTALERNVVSGNYLNGISVLSDNNIVQGNFVGTNVGGTVAVGNDATGILVQGSDNLIGGSDVGARNLVSGHRTVWSDYLSGVGIAIYDAGSITVNNNRVQGNWIGTDVTGSAPLGNAISGVSLLLGLASNSGNLIGGDQPGEGNLISGNNSPGGYLGGNVYITGSNSLVQGNLIGTELTGTASIGSQGSGIVFYIDAQNNRIGGSSAIVGGVLTGAGNVISGNTDGIRLYAASSNTFEGNFIGTDISGSLAIGNRGGLGISIDWASANNVVGGASSDLRNIISGNNAGVIVAGTLATGTQIFGNWIGLNATGTAPLPNATGVVLSTGTTGNTIGIGQMGQEILTSQDGNLVKPGGLVIVGGTAYVADFNDQIVALDLATRAETVTATDALLAGAESIVREASGDLVVNANQIGLVRVEPGTGATTLLSDFSNGGQGPAPGSSGAFGLARLPSGDFVVADLDNNRLLRIDATTGNRTVLSSGGLLDGPVSLALEPTGLLVVASANSNDLIRVDSADGTQYPLLGGVLSPGPVAVAPDGTIWFATYDGVTSTLQRFEPASFSLELVANLTGGSLWAGVAFDADGAAFASIAGSGAPRVVEITPGGNVISGNTGYGIVVNDSDFNSILGNRIGTNPAGTAAIANNRGIHIYSSTGNEIGGSLVAMRNLVSGNASTGIVVELADGNSIWGNFIGTTASGLSKLANNGGGVWFNQSADNFLGGQFAGEGNIISGNRQGGVFISSAASTGNLIRGNTIGLGSDGSTPVPNFASGSWDGDGIAVYSGANDNVIGGTAPGAGNVISGNAGAGIHLFTVAASASNSTSVFGNRIGTDRTGTLARGNATGVLIEAGSFDNVIGGTLVEARNVISGNTVAGVTMDGPGTTNNHLLGNYIGLTATGDSALANGDGVRVSGNADGNFIGTSVAPVSYAFDGSYQSEIVRTDVDADGDEDLIALLNDGFPFTDSILRVYRNDGTGALTPDADIALPGLETYTLTATYLDGDNLPDLLITNSSPFNSDDLHVMMNVGGSYAGVVSLNLPANPSGIGRPIVADFDGDSDLDIVVGRQGGFTSHLVKNDGGGVFLAPAAFADGNMSDGVVADFDGDGKADYATVSAGGMLQVNVRLGNGDGTFQPNSPVSIPSFSIRSLDAGDFDGDLKTDLIVATASDTYLLRGLGDGTFQAPAALGIGGQSNVLVRATDFDGDGSLDFVLSGYDSLHIVRGFGDGTFAPVPYLKPISNGYSFATGDLDADGRADLAYVVAGNFGGQLIVQMTEQGNVISGNASANIHIEDAISVHVHGNLIGTDAIGRFDITGGADGVRLEGEAVNTRIGGINALRNVISGSANGIAITGADATGTQILGNFIGLDASGTATLGNSTGIRLLNTLNHTIGGTSFSERNVIAASTNAGILVDNSSSNVIRNNFVGTEYSGTASIGNATGIRLANTAANNTLAGNVVSGNQTGVMIDGGSAFNTLVGGFIGTNPDGSGVIPNEIGVLIATTASLNTIGGPAISDRNIISGNTTAGVRIDTTSPNGNTVQGNYIGTDANGAFSLANLDGVQIRNSSKLNDIVGNLASGNTRFGIRIDGAMQNTVRLNLVGPDASSTYGIGNQSTGIDVGGGSENLIQENVVGGNAGRGIHLHDASAANIVQGNFVGTDATRTHDLGNGLAGITVGGGGTGNLIGGAYTDTDTALGNVVVFNLGGGIEVTAPGTSIRFNVANANTGFNIAVNTTPETGYPLIDRAVNNPGGLRVIGGFTCDAGETYRLDFYTQTALGGTSTFIGSIPVVLGATGAIQFDQEFAGVSVPVGTVVVGMATAETGGGTSDLSFDAVTKAALEASIPAVADVREGTPVAITAQIRSNNPDAVLEFSWSATKDGLPFATSSDGTFEFTPTDDGTYAASLFVRDITNGVTATFTTNDFVATNAAPVLDLLERDTDLAPPSVLAANQTLRLRARLSDPGLADTHTWQWTVNGADQGVSGPEFEYTATTAGLAIITATATDDDGGTGSAVTAIAVGGTLPAPIIRGEPTGRVEGTPIELVGTLAADYPAVMLRFRWTVLRDGVAFGAPFETDTSSRQASFTFIPTDNGSYAVMLEVSNPSTGEFSAPATTAIAVSNAPPTATIHTLGGPVTAGQPVSFNTTSSDPGGAGESLQHEWTVSALNGQSVPGGAGSAFAFTPASGGVFIVQLRTTDKDDGVHTTSTVIEVAGAGLGIDISGPGGDLFEGTPILLGAAVDPPGDPGAFTYSWKMLKNGDDFATGVGTSLIFTPDDGTAEGTNYDVIVSATGPLGASAAGFRRFTVFNAAPQPVIVRNGSLAVFEGDAVELMATANDPGIHDSPLVFWSVAGPGLEQPIVSESRVFSFQVPDDGLYTAMLTVTDKDGATGVTVHSFAVENRTPILTLRGGELDGAEIVVNAGYSDAGPVDDAAFQMSEGVGWFTWSLKGTPIAHETGPNFRFTPIPGTNVVTAELHDRNGAVSKVTTAILGGSDASETITVAPVPGADQILVLAFGGSDTIDASAVGSQTVVVDGGEGNDTIIGGGGNDVLVAGPGDNVVFAGNGDDLVIGGGSDTLDTGLGNDIIRPHFSNIVLADPGGTDTIDFTEVPFGIALDLTRLFESQHVNGDNTLELQGNFERLIGTASSDQFTGSEGSTLYGADGNDTLIIAPPPGGPITTAIGVLLDGGVGTDTLIVNGAISATLYGADGDDTISLLGSPNAVVLGGVGADTIFADPGSVRPTLYGADGDDTITTSAVDAVVLGGVGADIITAGGSNQLVIGGDAGFLGTLGTVLPTLYGASGDDTIELLGGSNSTVFAGDGNDRLLLQGANTATLYGADGKDTFVIQSGSGNVLIGDLGSDTLVGTGGQNNTLLGGLGTDLLILTGEAALGGASLYGADGDDTIVGTTGVLPNGIVDGIAPGTTVPPATTIAPILTGGSGADLVLVLGILAPTLYGGDGDDVLLVNPTATVNVAGVAFDPLAGATTQGAVLLGGAGTDLLFSGIGTAPTLYGADGNDTLITNNATSPVLIAGTTNSQTPLTGLGSLLLAAGGSNPTLYGADGNDTLLAGTGTGPTTNPTFTFGGITFDLSVAPITAPTLYGGDGNDVMVNAAGDGGTLLGDLGNDLLISVTLLNRGTLYGGDGNDTLLLPAPGQLTPVTVGSTVLDLIVPLFAIPLTGGTLYGADGNDTLIAGAGPESGPGPLLVGGADTTPFGIADDDLLIAFGTIFAPTLYGGDGNDTIQLIDPTPQNPGIPTPTGGLLVGGFGSDSILVLGGTSPTLYGAEGNDTLIAGAGSTLLPGNLGTTPVAPAPLLPFFLGGGGGDMLIALAGVQPTLYGGDGDDTILAGTGGTTVPAIPGVNVTGGTLENPILLGGIGADLVIAAAGVAPTLYGAEGNDTLIAGTGFTTPATPGQPVPVLTIPVLGGIELTANVPVNPTLYGGDGDDTILNASGDGGLYFGDLGNDLLIGLSLLNRGTLHGGDGNDTLLLPAPGTTTIPVPLLGTLEVIVPPGTLAPGGTLYGADGNDTLVAASGNSPLLLGGIGQDAIYAAAAVVAPTLYGGDGDDTIALLGPPATPPGTEPPPPAPGGFLTGGIGADLLLAVGGTMPTLYGADGNDTLIATAGPTLPPLPGVTVNLDGAVLPGSTSTVVVPPTGPVNPVLIGGIGSDLLSVAAGTAPTLYGAEGDDTLVANLTTNVVIPNGTTVTPPTTPTPTPATGTVLLGGIGADVLLVAAGTGASLYGETGDDQLFARGGTSLALLGGAGGDWLQNDLELGDTDVVLIGGSGDDRLANNSPAATQFWGGTGSDFLRTSGRADDVLFGEEGNDWYEVSLPQIAITLTFDEVRKYGAPDPAASATELDPDGTELTSEATTPGTDLPDFGKDVLSFAALPWISIDLGNTALKSPEPEYRQDVSDNLKIFLFGTFEHVVGTAGNDTIRGNSADNILIGNGGNDSLFGAAGNDTLAGGDGDNTLAGGTGDDVFLISGTDDGSDAIHDEDAADRDTLDFSPLASGVSVSLASASEQVAGTRTFTIADGSGVHGAIGTRFADTLLGTAGNDSLRGGAGNDSIVAGAGDDTLDGGDGDDLLDGGTGNDRYIQSVAWADTLIDEDGDDMLDFSAATAGIRVDLSRSVSQSIDDSGGSLTLLGSFENVLGSGYGDEITGSAVANKLLGGGGRDVLNGGGGSDYVQGGFTQVVYLDFDSRTSISEWQYSPEERGAILTRMTNLFAPFGIVVTASLLEAATQSSVVGGSYITVLFNEGPAGGSSDEIDFRNLNPGGTARVNTYDLLPRVESDPRSPSEKMVLLSGTIAAHEVEHLLGARHADAYGPVGGVDHEDHDHDLLDLYPETPEHVIASPDSVGITVFDAMELPSIGVREAIKIAFGLNGSSQVESALPHGTIDSAMALGALQGLSVPNTLRDDQLNHGANFAVAAGSVAGRIVPGETDVYSFAAAAGQTFTLEVMSRTLRRFGSATFDPVIRILDSNGMPIPFNDTDRESNDVQYLDVTFAEAGTYFIEITAATPSQGGRYELFIHSFAFGADPGRGDTLIGSAGSDTLVGGTSPDVIVIPADATANSVVAATAQTALNPATVLDLSDNGEFDAGDLEVVVIPPSPAPEFDLDAVLPESVEEGGSVAFGVPVVAGSAPVTYSLSSAPANASIDPETGEIAWSATDEADHPAGAVFVVKAAFAGGRYAERTVTIAVVGVAPTASFAAGPEALIEGETGIYSLSGSGDVSTADAASLRYSFATDASGLASNYGDASETNAFAFTPANDGTYTIHARVIDKDGLFTDRTMSIAVSNAAPIPAIDSISNLRIEGTSITVAGSATDPGANDMLTLSWIVSDASGTVASGTGHTIAFTPLNDGTYTIQLTASDGVASASTSQSIAVANAAPLPAIDTVSATRVEGTSITVTGSATDAGIHDSVSLSWIVLKGSDTVASGTGTAFSFTPEDDGSYTIQLTASDEVDSTTTSQTIHVSNAAPEPAIGSIPAAPLEGTTITATASAADAGIHDTVEYSWRLIQGRDVLATGTGPTFSFTPNDNDEYTLELTATDGTDTTTVSVPVSVGNAIPTATALSGPSTGTVGTSLAFSLAGASDASPVDAGLLRYSFATSAAGLASDYESAGTANAFATSFATPGTFTIHARVYDKDGGISSTFTKSVTVSVPGAQVYLSGNNLIVIGGTGNDTISITSAAGGKVAVSINGTSYGTFTVSGTIFVSGGDGNDTITVSTGVSRAASISGGAGNDTITGGGGNDTLDGGTGHDSLVAAGGDDSLTGGDGNDTLRGGTGRDSLDGGAGNDSLKGGAGASDTVFGGAGDDTLEGGSGGDLVDGGDGNDFIKGGSGGDTLCGSAGNDTITAGSGSDTMYGGAGNDSLVGGAGADVLIGGDGDDNLDGGSGTDVLVGGDGNDMLVGGAGCDLLIGGFGSDTLLGNAADDILIGGYTTYDSNLTALKSILCTWDGAGSYSARVAALQSNSHPYKLVADVTVKDDAAVDRLTGSAGTDWFIVNVDSGVKDVITDLNGNEIRTDVD